MRRLAAAGGWGCLVVLLAAGPAQAAEAPPASAPGGAAGRLSIVSQPGVEVVWEGVSLGETDASGLLVIEGIPPGSYELQLSKTGYRPRATEVEIGPGEQSVRLELRPPPVVKSPDQEPPRQKPPAQEPPVPRPSAAMLPEPTAVEPRTPTAGLAPAEGRAPATPPDIRPAPPSLRAGEPALPGGRDAPPTRQDTRQDSALPPVVYILGLGLLTATGAVALRRHQRARARAALLAQPAQRAFQPPPRAEEEPPEFLGDIQRREQVLEEWLAAGGNEAYKDAIDVEVEVIDLGPAEDAS